MIIIRYKPYGDLQYATVSEGDLKAQYPEKHRVKKVHNSPIGQIREIEGTGDYHKDSVILSFIGGKDRWGREMKSGSSVSRTQIKVLEHRSHVRTLTEADEDTLNNYDADIERLLRELKETRDERKAFLQSCWRRARPVGIGELEDRAKANLEARNG